MNLRTNHSNNQTAQVNFQTKFDRLELGFAVEFFDLPLTQTLTFHTNVMFNKNIDCAVTSFYEELKAVVSITSILLMLESRRV